MKINGLYEILYQIGKGSYATVHKAINKETGDVCAIKNLSVSTDFECLKNEIAIMSECKCENIVRFLASDCSGTEVSIVMEYCSGGSLRDVINNIGPLTEDQIRVIVKDILHGLDYLHSKNRIHRDVKAANILLSDDGMAKLGDFGVSERVDPTRKDSKITGTFRWLPPEVIQGDSKKCGPTIDIWSLGITILEMAETRPPYEDLEIAAAFQKTASMDEKSPTFKDPSKWSPDIIEFLDLCLVKNADFRKSASELLNHKVILETSSNDIVKKLVRKVCALNITRAGKDPCLTKWLLTESEILLRIYNERQMKVNRIDKMIAHLDSVKREFQDIIEAMASRDSSINESRKSFEAVRHERDELQRHKNALMLAQDANIERKRVILDELEKLRGRLTNFKCPLSCNQ